MNDTPAERGAESTWTRLRRRKVVQWGVVYVAAAWGFLQGLEYVSEAFHWPDQLRQIAVIALLIGLPVVLVLAWYHGDRGQQRISTPEFAILTLLLLLGGGAFWYYQRANETTVAAPPPSTAASIATDHSIAVLPFVNMSTDKEQEYFADGISEELLNLLAQVPELRVIARTSSFSFKGKDVEIAEIARRLNVANVLEGSVRRSGDTLRITAQLVRASDSSHLWSQTFDRHVTDIFNVQDEIARAVVEQLKIKLLGVAPKVRPTDPQAYALFLQGREVARRFSAASFAQAVDLYRQALAIDPEYAPAWDGLADAYFNQMDFATISQDQGLPLAKEAIRQTLKSDAQYAPAYARLALVEGIIEADFASGARHIERGLELDPANLEVISAAVFMARFLQRFDHGIALGRYIVSRDPVNELGHDRLALTYLYAGRLEEALKEFRIVLKLKPTFGGEHYMVGLTLLLQGDAEAALAEIQQEHMESWRLPGLVMAYYQLGRRAESDASLEEVMNKYGKALPSHVAYALAYRGEKDRAFELLEQADVRTISDIIMASHAVLAPLHSDPRWLPFLRKIGMAPEQLAAIKFDVKVPK